MYWLINLIVIKNLLFGIQNVRHKSASSATETNPNMQRLDVTLWCQHGKAGHHLLYGLIITISFIFYSINFVETILLGCFMSTKIQVKTNVLLRNEAYLASG